jgi:hypothetical protein
MIDLNGDDIYDLYLKLNSIKNALVASFTIKAIHESINNPPEKTSPNEIGNVDSQENTPAENQNDENKQIKKNNLWIYFIAGIFILCAALFVILFGLRKKQR